jgi:pyruvate/2-oxoglutarate dehydrogenase complex dihydrolipoamide dehydrogenase (E3) component
MIGAHAAEIVNIFSVVIKNELTVADLKKTIFAHPSVSEIVAELARSI